MTNGQHHATFGTAIQFGQDNTGDLDCLKELAGLRQAILPGGGIILLRPL